MYLWVWCFRPCNCEVSSFQDVMTKDELNKANTEICESSSLVARNHGSMKDFNAGKPGTTTNLWAIWGFHFSSIIMIMALKDNIQNNYDSTKQAVNAQSDFTAVSITVIMDNLTLTSVFGTSVCSADTDPQGLKDWLSVGATTCRTAVSVDVFQNTVWRLHWQSRRNHFSVNAEAEIYQIH